MVTVKLPDGKQLEFEDNVTAGEVVRGISEGLARHAVAAKVNGELTELFRPLSGEGLEFQALTMADPEGLEVARHSCAHVMAEAICELWPQTKLVYGPPVENGFYYDIDLDHPLTPEDFKAIEDKMKTIVKSDRPFTRYEVPRGEAMQRLEAEGNLYKVDNAERAEGDSLSFYVTGDPGSGCFEDLCRGPHVPSTKYIGAYKVMSVAGAYWHGDASKQMLQRVYGTCFADKKELKAYLHQLEEAKKRDHRKIGQEMGLFVLDPLVGTGLALWKPRGAVIRYVLEQTIRDELLKRGYQPVYTPQIGKLDLYRTSGHYPYYKESQFPPIFESKRAERLNDLWEIVRDEDQPSASENERAVVAELSADNADIASGYAFDAPVEDRLKRIRNFLQQEDGYLLRPMNCPHHIRIFGSERRSYRELPCRIAEFGQVYRYEQSGEVHGLTRVRGFCQDDAHIFCTQEQLPAEIADCIDQAKLVLGLVGMDDYRVRVGLRDPDSSKYTGSSEVWDKAEAAIREAVKASGLNYSEEAGEAAFYGPKIDFVAKDTLGREWQLGTVQVDYNLPERFDLSYIGEDNAEHRPIMVHRAPFGSLERFVGILIEHFAGNFPLWLAPIQAAICPVSDKSAEYAQKVFSQCQQAGLRVEMDASGDRIGAKIRRATLDRVPYIVVIGEQEAATGRVNVRTRSGEQLGSPTLPEFLHGCALEIANRDLEPTLKVPAESAAS
jgi:threonyl-tRNA synthetase